MKTLLVFMMVGGILGAVAASFIAPPVLSWYSEPAAMGPEGSPKTICDPAYMVRYTASRLYRWQLAGAGIGALLFFYPGIATVRRRRAAVAAPSPAAV